MIIMYFQYYNCLIFYKKTFTVVLFLFVLIISLSTFAEEKKIYNRTLKWENNKKITTPSQLTKEVLSFEGAMYDYSSGLAPFYFEQIALTDDSKISVRLVNTSFLPLEFDISLLENLHLISSEIEVKTKVTYQSKIPFASISFIPIRLNVITGQYEKLVFFEIELLIQGNDNSINKTNKINYAANSVLASGKWYKIGVTQNGLYKLTYSNLTSLGMDLNSVNPKYLRIYGNGGGVMPQPNSYFHYDDLVENSIYVDGESDGSFGSSDYILFYAEGPHQWQYDSTAGIFTHLVHYYSDTNYYFITADLGPGKRIETQTNSINSANVTVTTFDDYLFHESENRNFVKSGREWYGEEFDLTVSQNFSFSFPNLVISSPLNLVCVVAAHSTSSSSFDMLYQGSKLLVMSVGAVSDYYADDYVKLASVNTTFNAADPSITLTLNYNKTNSNSLGYLDYIALNATRDLKMSGEQMLFRSVGSVGTGKVAEFVLTNAASSYKVWEITDPLNAKQQETVYNNSEIRFTLNTDSLREFVVFAGNSFFTPFGFGKIDNQDIHGTVGQPDLVIITHPDFINEARKLAAFHKDKDALDTAIVIPQQIYNEFSSGVQDVSAIRNFLKMLYDRAGSDITKLPQYLLLFGDASYDYKNKIMGNTNFVPSFQSINSYSPTSSYVSDDYYGFLDDAEGSWPDAGASEALDIGIGRIPAKTKQEAEEIINKIFRYVSSTSFGDWRNIITFIADDEDNNLHISDADDLATYVADNHREYNIDKIYFDAYQQTSTSGGQRYPDVNKAINQRMQIGTFILNYTGHGGEVGLSLERVLGVSDINSWDNANKMPLIITATCEFSRFDDPERTSAGELCFLNPYGGAVALITTVRLVYANSNKTLNMNFYGNFLKTDSNGEIFRLGDIMKNTKNASGTVISNRNFTLLGDPALRLAYPKQDIVTTKINGVTVSAVPDTLKALSKMTIEGEVRDKTGNLLTDFNGTVYPTIYDKSVTITTLQNDPGSNAKNFELQKNMIYTGKASVVNGKFSYTFIVPKDILYNPDNGKLSYYAHNGQIDANGVFENIIVSGTASTYDIDETPPLIKLYLNDEKFVFGGLTDENPLMIAKVYDLNGINTAGSLGHEIAAVLDADNTQKIVLNEYYEAALDDYQNGEVRFPFKKLNAGKHTLSFKVWDVYNNSSEEYTEFVVASSAKLALDHVFNYPNPFTTNTNFQFEHNKPGELLTVQIQIFTITGKLIKTIETTVTTEGNRIDFINWDGLDDFGDKIGRGVYIYRLKVKSSSSEEVANKYEKLVILR